MLFEYSEIKLYLKDDGNHKDEIHTIETIRNFVAVTECNRAWNCYDLDGVLHSYNWDVIRFMEVRQKTREIKEVI